MSFLQIILIVYLALSLFALLLYIPKISCWVYGFKQQKRLTNPKQNKLAIIVPAREESACIDRLLNSINKQTYPSALFDTFIVVAREDDPTIEMAHSKLKNVDVWVERNQTCKAEAMDSLFQHIFETKGNIYDGYIIVDADSYLDDDYLTEINNAMITEADVIISKKKVINWESNNKKQRTLFANLSGLTYTAIDTMGNKYKSDYNYALAICGNGMLLSKRYVTKFDGFPFRSICEDVEVGINAMLNGFKECYYEHAIIYTEEPISHKEYNKRRYRWLKGYFSNNANYNPELYNKTFKQGKIVRGNLKYLFELMPVYLFICITVVALLTFLISGIALSCVRSPLTKQAFLFALLIAVLVYAVISIFNFITILEEDSKKLKFGEKLAIIFIGPFITFEYVIVFFRTINKNYKVEWEPIERITIDETN